MMKMLRPFVLPVLLALCAGATQAAAISVELRPASDNPPTPTMGDWMHFRSVIHNNGAKPLEGLVAWISLVAVTPGKEQPMNLEDWSAHKAVTGARLAPGGSLYTAWPLRLIQGGDYRVVISATDRTGRAVYTSETVQFHVARKPVVASTRILPVALGVPLLITGLMSYNGVRGRSRHEGGRSVS
jgi:hypothetical protein